jgi:uncharacterized membrane protein
MLFKDHNEVVYMSSEKNSGAKEGQACAALSYILVGIIWYFADEQMKKNTFVKFHVKQGLVSLIFSVAWSIALSIVGSILGLVLFFLWPIMMLLYWVPLIFTILGIINAVNGKEKELPIIGKFASKFTF